MAIFHLNAHVVSRGKGQSAIAKAAYNSRTKLEDERTGLKKDYSRMDGVIFSGIFAPKDAPAWANDRQQLWNAVERREDESNRANRAQLAREIRIALPHELTDQQREWLVKDWVREQLTRRGMVADVNIHAPGGEGDDRNHHAHILVTMRELRPDGFGPKVREWNSREQVEQWRERWEHLANKHLERHGHEARIDRRTLEAQGVDRQPTTHRGPHVDAIERRGVEADNTRENADRRAELAELRAALTNITHDIAAERRAHFERMMTDDNYRREYEQQQRAAARQQEEKENERAANDNAGGGDWSERAGMAQQQASALDYAKRVQASVNEKAEKGRADNPAEPANTNEQTDAAQAKEEKRDRQRQAIDQREKSDKDQVFQHIQSVTGRDFRQR